jgi:anti-sigma factor RsiW
MNQKEHECCQDLIPYLVGELSSQRKNEFEKHVKECSICRDELQELQSVWDSLPLAMEEVDPPADLKAEVFSSIFPNEPSRNMNEPKKRETTQEQEIKMKQPNEMNRWKSLFRSGLGKIAVVLLVLLAGVVWNNLQLRGQLIALQEELIAPTQIVQAYSMEPADTEMVEPSGNAWVLQSGKQKRLVVHMNGLQSTQGQEAYQVWLIHDGKRQSAGTFRVDETGRGVITYYFNDPDVQFESIGITLEPDPYGDQPRGKKVSGTI